MENQTLTWKVRGRTNIKQKDKNVVDEMTNHDNHEKLHRLWAQSYNEKGSLILSTAAASFCSSSGHISGQWVKPKYTTVHLPKKSFSVTGFPLWSMRLNGPPMAAFPAEGPCFTEVEAVVISVTSNKLN